MAIRQYRGYEMEVRRQGEYLESFIVRLSDGYVAHEQYGDSMWDGTIKGEWDYLKRLIDEAEDSYDPWHREENAKYSKSHAV